MFGHGIGGPITHSTIANRLKRAHRKYPSNPKPSQGSSNSPRVAWRGWVGGQATSQKFFRYQKCRVLWVPPHLRPSAKAKPWGWGKNPSLPMKRWELTSRGTLRNLKAKLKEAIGKIQITPWWLRLRLKPFASPRISAAKWGVGRVNLNWHEADENPLFTLGIWEDPNNTKKKSRCRLYVHYHLCSSKLFIFTLLFTAPFCISRNASSSPCFFLLNCHRVRF